MSTSKNITQFSDYFIFGDKESMEDLNRCLLKILQDINKAGLTALTVNVLLKMLGDIANEMTDTPEKELKVCLGKDFGIHP